MRQGTLVPYIGTERMTVYFAEGDFFGKLHCSQPLEALLDGIWQPTQMEYAKGGWRLKGVDLDDIVGLTVRI